MRGCKARIAMAVAAGRLALLPTPGAAQTAVAESPYALR